MPSINLNENKNVDSLKIIDREFDKKLEEYKTFKENIETMINYVGNFSNQTNSILTLISINKFVQTIINISIAFSDDQN